MALNRTKLVMAQNEEKYSDLPLAACAREVRVEVEATLSKMPFIRLLATPALQASPTPASSFPHPFSPV